jgi:hypothetical protein
MRCSYDVLIHVHSSHIRHVHNPFLIQRHVTLEVNRAVVAELLSSHPVKNNKLDILRMIRGVAED